jgi:hypothetical protein
MVTMSIARACPEPKRTSTLSRLLFVGAFVSVVGLVAQDAEARSAHGGFRGGATSASRAGNFSGFGRGAGQRRTNQRSRPANAQRPTGDAAHAGTAVEGKNSATVGNNTMNSGNRTGFVNGGTNRAVGNGNSGVVGSGNGNGNVAVVNNGNVNNSGVVNAGNVNVGNDVNVNVGNGGWVGGYGYAAGSGAAYATGVAVGSTATAAAIGSYYYALPAGCSPYVWNSHSYYSCAGAWYQQRYQSGTTVYVVVADPTKK